MKNSLLEIINNKISNKIHFNPGIVYQQNTSVLFDIISLKMLTHKPVYIIYRENGGSGFFSNVLFVFRHIQIAEELGFTPVVDFKNYPTIYSLDNNPLFEDSWHSYFEPLSEYSVEDAYLEQNVIRCDGRFPANASMSYDIGNERLFTLFTNKIKINNHLQEEIKKSIDDLKIISGETLGIHWRGNEQNHSKGHWFGPTEKQIFNQTDKLLTTGEYSQIFVSTENTTYLNLMIKRYGQLVKYNNYPRSNSNIYKDPIRKDHYFLLGKEILTDAIILSRCKGFIHASSNVSDFAAFMNNGQYNVRIKINNGENRTKYYSFSYLYKKHLPSTWHGLKNEIIHFRNDTC